MCKFIPIYILSFCVMYCVTRFCLLFFYCVLVYIFGTVYLATKEIHASFYCCNFSYNSKNTNLYCDLRKSHRRSSQSFSSLLLFLLPTRPSGPQRQPLGHFWKSREFLLSFLRALQLYRIESVRPPGHPVTPAVLRETINATAVNMFYIS